MLIYSSFETSICTWYSAEKRKVTRTVFYCLYCGFCITYSHLCNNLQFIFNIIYLYIILSTSSCFYYLRVFHIRLSCSESHALFLLLGANAPASQQAITLQLAASCCSLVSVSLHPSIPFSSFALHPFLLHCHVPKGCTHMFE